MNEPHTTDENDGAPRAGDQQSAGARRAGALQHPPPAGPPPRNRHRVLLVVAAALLAVLVPATAVLFSLWRSAERDVERLDDVRRVAGTFTDRFLTVDAADIEAWKESVTELSTGAFRRTFEQGLETQFLQELLATGQVTTDTTVEEVFVGDVDSRAAHVVVQAFTVSSVVDEEGTVGRRPPFEFFIELDLVHQDEGWLVDAVANLNFAGPPAAPGGGAPGGGAPGGGPEAGGP